MLLPSLVPLLLPHSDPNNVFHNCAPSGRETSFPPWYVGYTNSTTKPLDIPSSASRYGNRGAYALKMQQSNRNSTRKIGEHLPHFLSYPNPTNEFTPKLNAAPLKPNGATFCSPKDWPDSAAYPSGFKKKVRLNEERRTAGTKRQQPHRSLRT